MPKQVRISRERRKELLRRLKEQIGPHKKDLQLASFFSWIQFLMRVASFYILARQLEQVYNGQPVDFLLTIGSIVLFNIIGFLSASYAKRYQGVASQYARNQLKKQFFQAFVSHEGEFDEQTSMHDVMTIASQGIDTLDTYFHMYLSITYRTYLNCTTVLLLVAAIFPLGSVLFLISLPLIPVSIVLIQKRSKKIMQHYWSTYMDVGNLFMDNLNGLNTLYTYQADQKYENEFVKKAEEFRLSTMELLKFQLQSVGYMDGVMYIGVGVSGFFAAVALSQGTLSLWAVVFFVLIAAEFFAPIREMGYGMHLVMMNTKMADRIFTFLDETKKDVEVQEDATLVSGAIHSLSLQQASFSYEGQEPLFSDVTVTIQKGELFAIAGESGAGKTTLARILQQKLPLTSGTLLVNEKEDVRFQQDVLSISSTSYVFNGTIYDNLTIGNSYSKEELYQWIQQHHILQFIHQLPDGLDTVVGEGGNQLSPGQRQQLICARALLNPRSIYIFDEVTSSVDSEQEKLIFHYITLLSRKAIVIFISHKMKQVMQADRVLFIDQNQKMMIGTPQQLLDQHKEFKQLVETQEKLEEILHG